MTTEQKEKQLRSYYQTLHRAWGPQHWWPAHSRFEVIVGAFLTQNTSWTNVEIALRQLRAARLLTLAGIRDTPVSRLEILIRSSGYFRQKAARLKTFVAFVEKHYSGSLSRFFSQPTEKLRTELLSLNGVGPETADSILLYAGQHPVFVVDAYTRRILERHEVIPESAAYDEIRKLFEHSLTGLPQEKTRPGGAWTALPSRMSRAKRSGTAQIYNDMHGLIVRVGKNYCLKSKALCEECPLQKLLPSGGPFLRWLSDEKKQRRTMFPET